MLHIPQKPLGGETKSSVSEPNAPSAADSDSEIADLSVSVERWRLISFDFFLHKLFLYLEPNLKTMNIYFFATDSDALQRLGIKLALYI